jgi:hypothetical protein
MRATHFGARPNGAALFPNLKLETMEAHDENHLRP